MIHPTHSAGRTVPYAFHDEEQPWSGEDLNTVRASGGRRFEARKQRPNAGRGQMRAREFDIKLIDADIEEFKNLLDVFRDVFDWGDHDHPDEEYLLGLLKDDNLLVVVAKAGNEVVGGLTAYVLPGYEVARPSVYVHDLGAVS